MSVELNVRTLAALITGDLEAGLVAELVGTWTEVTLPGYHRCVIAGWEAITVGEDGAAMTAAGPLMFGPFEADSAGPIAGAALFAPGGQRPLRIVPLDRPDRRPMAAGETLTVRIRLSLEVTDE